MAMVANRMVLGESGTQFYWEWRCGLSTQRELEEFEQLSRLLHPVMIVDREDAWCWEVDKGKGFSVKSVRGLLTKKVDHDQSNVFPWNSWLPLKVIVFGWRALLDRLPTRIELSRRNVNIGSLLCPFCNEVTESLDHIFTGWFILQLWSAIEVWCHLSPIIAFSVKDLIFLHKSINGSMFRKSMVQSVILVTCWVVWRTRNNIVFKCKKANISCILSEIKTLGYLWIKNRATKEFSESLWNDFSFQ